MGRWVRVCEGKRLKTPLALTHVPHLCDAVDANAAHGANSKGADERVWVAAVLDKGVDSHEGEVGLCLGIAHEVQVHELLQLQVVRLHAVHNIREQCTAANNNSNSKKMVRGGEIHGGWMKEEENETKKRQRKTLKERRKRRK